MDDLYLLILGTQYMFWVGFVGMAAGTLYFMAERGSLPDEYKSTATVAALVTFVAAIHYYTMKETVGTSGQMEDLLRFPTEVRYIDWLITTPLLLVKFPVLLGLKGAVGRDLLIKLVGADMVMILAGYVGETALNQADPNLGIGWLGFLVSMAAWGYIIKTLYKEVTVAAQDKPEPIKNGLITMRHFIVIGWAIYPLGYFVSLVGGTGEGAEAMFAIRELVYNIADLVNKVGFGLVALFAVQALATYKQSEADAVPAKATSSSKSAS